VRFRLGLWAVWHLLLTVQESEFVGDVEASRSAVFSVLSRTNGIFPSQKENASTSGQSRIARRR
jgi:hypothetical protein